MASSSKSIALEKLRGILRAGDVDAACALLSSTAWGSLGPLHPVFELLSCRGATPPALARMLDALIDGGWDPHTLHSGAIAWDLKWTRGERQYLSSPFGDRSSLAASLSRRVAGVAGAGHRLALAAVLKSHGIAPDPGAWAAATARADFALCDFWRAAGHEPPPPSSRFKAAMSSSRGVFSFATAARLLKELSGEGWEPSPEQMASVSQVVFVAAWLDRCPAAPSWSTATRANVLMALWREIGNYGESLPQLDVAALMPKLMAHPEWRVALNALHAPISGLPAPPGEEMFLAPTWNALVHPIRRSFRDAVFASVRPFIEGSVDFVGTTHTHAEAWAGEGASPALVASHPLGSLAPNPRTNRWPCAGARRFLREWVEACGGWRTAARAPTGPLAEMTARIIKERALHLIPDWRAGVESVPPGVLAGCSQVFDGLSVAGWAAGRPDLAATWANATRGTPGTAPGSPSAMLRSAILSASVPRVRAALKNVPSAERAGWSHPSTNPLGLLLSHDWGVNRAVRSRVITLVSLLAAAGVPWPQDQETWDRSVLFEPRNGRYLSPGMHPDVLPAAEWLSWRAWPSFLARYWVGTVDLSLRSSLVGARRDQKVEDLVAILDNADDRHAAASLALAGLMQRGLPSLKGESAYLYDLTPIDAKDLAVLVPAIVSRMEDASAFDFRGLLGCWNKVSYPSPASTFWSSCASLAAIIDSTHLAGHIEACQSPASPRPRL